MHSPNVFSPAALDRLRRGAEQLGCPLTGDQVAALAVYGAELLAANRRINLTAITDPAQVIDRHFLDSLAVAAQPEFRRLLADRSGPPAAIDIGTGAGFPGLPLKIALPDLPIRLIEATAKKAGFVQAIVDRLGLTGVEVIVGRAEDLAHRPDLREAHDLGLARALAPLPVLLELTLPFVRIGGRLILHKSWPWAEELAAAEVARERLGGAWVTDPAGTNPGLEPRYRLLVVAKVAPTPPAYPRRAGVPAKRPLGVPSGRTAARTPDL